MLRVALTGGVATGKSYCLARFRAAGVPVIDADRLAREAVAPGSPGLAATVKRFGTTGVTADGTLDRGRLGALVFADPVARRDLEAIVHPYVYRAITKWYEQMAAAGARLAIADIPLLFETGHEGDFDRVIVATCPEDLQIQRLALRDGLDARQARARLAAQWPLARKVGAAHFVIDTGGSFDATDRQVDDVIAALRLL
jgi:dephospho-CoA kinase